MVDISERDARMFKMLSEGHSRVQIANALGMTGATVTRRINLLRTKTKAPRVHVPRGLAKAPRVHVPRGLAADAAEKQKAVIAMWGDGKSKDEIAAATGLALSTIDKRIRLLEDLGTGRNEMPRGDHEKFLAALRKDHVEGAGEVPGIAGRGHFVRISAVSPRSGVGSPQQLCVEN